MSVTRRNLIASAATAAAQTALPAGSQRFKIGVDSYSIRLNEWSAAQYLDYLGTIDVQVAHLSTTRELREILTDRASLLRVRAQAEKLGLALELSMGSICPTAKEFDPKLGTAEDQIVRGLNAARILGSRVMRVFLGGMGGRSKAVPIEAHMESTLRVLRKLRTRIVDSGVRIAVENHGDLQAREIKALVEEAGRDILGVCLDSGNPLYILEDPHLTLEMLAPYTATSHIRDTAVWRVPAGIAVQWVRVGEGNVNTAGWIKSYAQLCPGLAVSMESIVMPQPTILPIFDPSFWDSFPQMPAWELARFLALADQGKPAPPAPLPAEKTAGEQQCQDLEASIHKVRRILS